MPTSLGLVDVVVLACYLAGVMALGMWVGRGQRDLNSYLLGDRNLPWWSLLISIVATETSTATFLSVPGIAYAREGGDLRFLQLPLGYLAGRCIIAVVLLPLYFRGQMYSAYQVLHDRFGGPTKQAASLIFLVTRNLGDGLRLYLTAIALERLTGLSLPVCIAVIGVATIVYTVFGGMRSVVWNDCIQFAIYMAGGLIAGVIIVQRLPGGWEQFVNYGLAHDKFRLFDFHLTLSLPYTFWAGMLGGMFLTLGTHGTDQLMVQRYLSARNQREAARALVLSGAVVLVQFLVFLLLGVGLACFYDAVRPETQFPSSDYVFASFIVNELPRNVGLIGLLLSAVLAAAMSTLASSLNSSASALINDFYLNGSRRDISPRRLLYAGRVATVFFGVVQIIVGILAAGMSQSVVQDALAIASFSAGLLLGVFFLGIATRRVGQQGALVGLVFGLIVLCTVKFVLPRFDIVIAWPWFALIGSAATFAAGAAWSGRRSEDVARNS